MINVIYRLHNDDESARVYSEEWMKRNYIEYIVKNEWGESM